ncbi:ATPase_AAA_core domain-containing protein [Pseudomonas sp. IT-P258]|uniref:ATP-binding protein n=1 Tax=Pseudomonas sp. IT-P258 TaxID=3026447 RepID=UPI0039E16A93
MSKAGIQSNRGDGFQSLVAFGWALSVLEDPDYHWLEVDSVTWSVDDVVIGRKDGGVICCQCKKNQTQFKSWSIADLYDELIKANEVLSSVPKSVVCFYSRTPFGEMAALREYSTNYSDVESFNANLGKAHAASNSSLKKLLESCASSISVFDFLSRIKFETTPDLERMQELLFERLRRLASNSSAAYNALWVRICQLGMRFEEGDNKLSADFSRLTKSDVNELIVRAGAMLIPAMDVVEVKKTFESTSSIGRSWRRDIGHERLKNPILIEVIKAVEEKCGSILITGAPGSGKTCIMLDLQEELEKLADSRSDLVPLFIQSREFADLYSVQDRHALGLAEQWVGKVARLADDVHVVVVIDSLDVLSIAREHSVLQYFLAQIDRLLLIPNVTVVTACRDFDRNYDRSIAQRKWVKEFHCKPLDWDADVEPLLSKMRIDLSSMDSATRKLICNPRELALFVDLARTDGSFNVVTSQGLAQRYLRMTIQSDKNLGDSAIQALEDVAMEMLRLRSLAVPRQFFPAAERVLRALLSHDVLHEAQEGKLTFGHQTLLDVLVISGAVRRGMTLHEFIEGLPPVPFVRPTIRSFVAQLAAGGRREFRKQLRTVLTGNHAFHIRRLVAESFAEQLPCDADWPLIRELRNSKKEIFQVIYGKAVQVEWYGFWLKHLVPLLREESDADGLIRHAHRVSLWLVECPVGVLEFWQEILHADNLDKTSLINQMAISCKNVKSQDAPLLAPLLVELLKLPNSKSSFLGQALANCVSAGGLDDVVLWDFIAGDVCEADVLGYRLGKNLQCQSHQFGDRGDQFLLRRMQSSTQLLDLVVKSIEMWSSIKYQSRDIRSSGYRTGFLSDTSYNDDQCSSEYHHDNERVLFDLLEKAVVSHAETDSLWWKGSRERLCFNVEGALRYFALRGCIAAPRSNLDLIEKIICDKGFLNSGLKYQVGVLIKCAFLQLDYNVQDAAMDAILDLHQGYADDVNGREYMVKEQSQLLACIPRHLRSEAASSIVLEYEQIAWPVEWLPAPGVKVRTVLSPFSYEVFLALSDLAVLKILEHYDGYVRDSFDEFMTGGEREVGWELREAASRSSMRFLRLLKENWDQITERFRDCIMDGVAVYLSCRFGNRKSDSNWQPTEEPDALKLMRDIFEELEGHSQYWQHNRVAASALQASAHIVTSFEDSFKLTVFASMFLTLDEESSVSGDNVDLITHGINMARGDAVEALMIMASRLKEDGCEWPVLLAETLYSFASDKHPAIRALILRRLPYLMQLDKNIGWKIFDMTMQEPAAGLWAIAESCLYYTYHRQFEIVGPWLLRLYVEGEGKDFKTWARISALAALSKNIDQQDLISKLRALENEDAWKGAISIWTNESNLRQCREFCLDGLNNILQSNSASCKNVAHKFTDIFRQVSPPVLVPLEFIENYFAALGSDSDRSHRNIYGFDGWLNAVSGRDPMFSLKVTQVYLAFAQHAGASIYDLDHNFTQLLTRLFSEAEEREESDKGEMLGMVVAIQDAMLALGVNGVSEWLEAAERS